MTEATLWMKVCLRLQEYVDEARDTRVTRQAILSILACLPATVPTFASNRCHRDICQHAWFRRRSHQGQFQLGPDYSLRVRHASVTCASFFELAAVVCVANMHYIHMLSCTAAAVTPILWAWEFRSISQSPDPVFAQQIHQKRVVDHEFSRCKHFLAFSPDLQVCTATCRRSAHGLADNGVRSQPNVINWIEM